nr:phage repressor protein CI [Klebsiella quasipneumoniae]
MKAPKEHFEFNFKIAFGICQCNSDCFGGLLDFNSGGKKAIERLVEAYGFSTRQALCDHLGVSKSTMATRYMRDIFPADWVIRCSLETGVSLEWLTSGKGVLNQISTSELITLDSFDLHDGELINIQQRSISRELLPEILNQPYIVNDNYESYIISKEYNLVDGLWLISIDGQFSLRSVYKLPNNRIRVENEKYSFECGATDIEINNHIKGIIKRRV